MLLTGYLEHLLTTQLHDVVEIFTPADPNRRGAQLSLRFVGQKTDVEEVYQELKRRGVICDTRKPDVMRVAPAPLYNSFADVHRFVCILKEILYKV